MGKGRGNLVEGGCVNYKDDNGFRFQGKVIKVNGNTLEIEPSHQQGKTITITKRQVK